MSQELQSTFYHSPVGWLQIDATDHYIAAIRFLDEPPQNLNSEISPLLIQCTEELIQYFQKQRRVFEVPFHQSGTEFQEKTWHALSGIPFGKTMSYLDLARQTGDEKATRAVGTANNKNNIAIVVPCHRVIGANGKLVGYGGGLWRKKWLLEHEWKIMHGVQTLF